MITMYSECTCSSKVFVFYWHVTHVQSDLPGFAPFGASDACPAPILYCTALSSISITYSQWSFVTVRPRGCLHWQPFFTRTSQTPLAIPMSTSDQTAGPSTDNFTAIFNAASVEYQTLTGKSLDTHPLAARLDSCHNPEAISDVLRTQAQAFSKFRKGDERLMAWLDPTVHILCTFSDTLGEGVGLVSNLIYLHDCSRTPSS